MLRILQISMYADLQTLVTCFSIDRLLESVTPRFFAWEEKGISVFPIWKVVGDGFGKYVPFDAISRDLVLPSLGLSLLAVTHVFTSEMQFCMLWTEASIWSGQQELYSWMSSAKDWLKLERCQKSIIGGFVYKINKTGPRTVPYGTPKLSMNSCKKVYFW